MFKVLGLLAGLYALHAVVKGEVYAKAGAFGRIVSRDTSPEYFWVVVVIYAGVAIALATLFQVG